MFSSKPNIEINAFSPSTREAKVDRSLVQGQSTLQSKVEDNQGYKRNPVSKTKRCSVPFEDLNISGIPF